MRWLYHRGYLLMAIAALLWAANIIIGRGIHEQVPPIGLNFWRWLPTLPIFVAMAWPQLRRDWPVMCRHWPWMVVLAALAVTAFNAFVYLGLDRTTAVNMLLISTSRPAMIVLLSFLLFRIRIDRAQLTGLILGFVGAAVIVLRGDLDVLAGFQFNPGDLWIFLATLAWSFYTVLLPKRPPIHPASFMAYAVAIGLLLLLPFYLWETATVEPFPVTWASLSAILFLALFSSVIAHLCYNRAVDLLGANRAGTTAYMVLGFGVVLAIGLLGEAFESYHLLGLALLVAATWLVARPRRPA